MFFPFCQQWICLTTNDMRNKFEINISWNCGFDPKILYMKYQYIAYIEWMNNTPFSYALSK